MVKLTYFHDYLETIDGVFDSLAAVASIQLVPKYIKSESNIQIFYSETIVF